MARNRNRPRSGGASASSRSRASGVAIVAVLLVLGAAVFALNRKPAVLTSSGTSTNAAMASQAGSTSNLPVIEINQALMVTVELDFGGPVPTIAEALRDIERRHQPSNGGGRVFAILDAYGEPTPDGKKLHMSMHVSTEKPGIGSLVFKRTGELLWSSRIISSTNAPSAFSGTALTILLDNGTGRMVTVDGSGNPSSILEAAIKETGQLVGEAWPEGGEYEVTFIYSACGCPVKVKCQRLGDRTVRTKELPVIFPDDPSAVALITRLMRW